MTLSRRDALRSAGVLSATALAGCGPKGKPSPTASAPSGPLNTVTVDTAGKVARIGAGAKLAEVYAALAAKGVAIVGGSCPTVGITGLALGGGLDLDPRAWTTCKVLANKSTGRRRALVSGAWIGPATETDLRLRPLLDKLPAPESVSRRTFSYGEAMRFFAGSGSRVAFAATSSARYERLPPAARDAIAAHVEAAMDVPGLVEGGILLDALGGAVAQTAPDATAFAHRHAIAIIQYTATFAAGAAVTDTYVRDLRKLMRPYCGDWAYVKYADPSIVDYGTAYWGANYERLRAVKKAVDPHNLFTFPQAVQLPS